MTAREEKLEMIREAREMYTFEGGTARMTDEQILERDVQLRREIFLPQRQELDDAEVVEQIDDGGWLLTINGVWIEPDGNRNYGGV